MSSQHFLQLLRRAKGAVIVAEGDTYRLRIVLRRSAVHPACINNFYFRQEDPLILDTPGEDLVEAWRDDCEVEYTGLFTNFIAITQYQVAKAPLFLTEYIADFVGIGGLMSGDPLPPRNSICLSNRTADISRRGRGRVYLPPANEAVNQFGAPTSAYAADVLAFGNQMLPTIGDGIGSSFYTPMMWSEADQEAKVISSYFVVPRWTSQRDRDGILSA